MLAGHLAAGLALARADRRLNAGTVVTAALLLDLLLWAFVLLGWESVSIPPDYEDTHVVSFVFPYTHSLVAALAWSLAAGGLVALRVKEGRKRAALVVGIAVFSHWLLDALVHPPELPLAGAHSIRIGLGLWNLPPLGIALESVLVMMSVAIVLSDTSLPGTRRMGLTVLAMVLLTFTIAGMTIAMAPPSPQAMAGTSLVMLIAVCAATAWFDAARSPAGAQPRLSAGP